VRIAIDILDAARDVDTVILLSGDGDFDLLLQKITKDHDCRAEVYGVRSLTANSLIDAASRFHSKEPNLLHHHLPNTVEVGVFGGWH
jgi:uncharacterized LabA/DUF88 family protein